MAGYTGYTGITDNVSKVRPTHNVPATTSPWFAPGAPTGPLTAEAQMMQEYLMDAAVGSTAAVTGRKVTRTPLRISSAAFNEFAADEMAAFKRQRVIAIRNKNLRSK